ncbi:tetratricopeptide repeat protein, partial [Pseudomonadota bacterium]|nr:tetratricopeptide repeat protein [Pseudomonadota bacterium]
MLAKLSVDQALMKASSHIKRDEILEAQKLYQAVLLSFPKNIRAQQGLAHLNKANQNNAKQSLSKETIDQLINLYNQGQLLAVVEKAQALTEQYPEAFIIWNILGMSAVQLKMLDDAIEAYKKCIILKPDYAEAYINMGVALKDQGKFEEAIEAYNKALLLKPDYAVSYSNIGNALKGQGKLEEAIEAYKKALSLKPDYADAYINIGNALKDQGKLEEAIQAYNKCISLKPDYEVAYNNIGKSFQEQGKLDDAIEAYNECISLKPDYADAYINIGNALKDQGKLEEAIQAYNKCISLKPDYAVAYNNLGKTFQEQGKLDDAIEAYNKAISKPDYPDPYINMGNVLQEQGKLDEAIVAYNQALLIKPDYAEAYNNMGVALRDQGKVEESIDAYNACITLKPNHAEAYNNMGMTLQYQGKLDEAIDTYNKAISLKPDYPQAHQNLSYALLNSGKLLEGLDEYEWRWKTDKFFSQQRHFLQPVWDGQESLHGKRILLWCEQGIGDTINWSSCLSLVASQAEHCILECQEKLVPLLKHSFPNIDVKTENRRLDLERDDFDVHLPMGSLYKHFCQEIIKNPKAEAFLIPDPVRVKFWRKRLKFLGNGPYIGISWKSSIMTTLRGPNYSSISEWSPILKISDVTFINMQYVDFNDDLNKIKDNLGVTVHNFDDLDHYNNITDVAALAGALDIVVSNKTTVPLISAGVGTTTKLVSWKQSSWNNI